jgi:chromosome partitioning protein
MHLIVGLLELGFKVGSIDVDCRQGSLSSYLDNRRLYNDRNPDKPVLMPQHILMEESLLNDIRAKNDQESELFAQCLAKVSETADVIVIDTPGTNSFLSRLAHSYADTVITPMNDSFIDLSVMAKIDPANMKIIGPSVYSQMVWEQKLERAKRDRKSIDWVVMRNRLSSVDAQNKRNVAKILNDLSKRISFRQVSGFGERVIFRELFLQGLTLLDLKKANYDKVFTISHVAARQELRDFLSAVNVSALVKRNIVM